MRPEAANPPSEKGIQSAAEWKAFAIGSRARIQGIGEEFRFLASFRTIGNELSAPLTGLDFTLTPNFMLTDDSLEAAIRTSRRSMPGWMDSVDQG